MALSSPANTYRFWITGTFASNAVTVNFIPGSYSFVPTGYNPASVTGSVSNNAGSTSGVLTVTFPDAPTGLAIDPGSIIRNVATLFSSLTVTGVSGETIALTKRRPRPRSGPRAPSTSRSRCRAR